jgi:polyhydroxyalkanoate synthesis repressor PhaR
MPSTRRAADDTEAAAPAGAGAAAGAKAGAVRVLKKYPNRRLYDTQSSSYITLADVKKMVLAGEDFEVRDAKTHEDLTRSILLQIILEEESAGAPMFSTPMLAQIIRIYGQAMQGVMGSMFEQNMKLFGEMQSQMLERGGKGLAPEAFNPLLAGQAPLMQQWMERYAENSRQMFDQMREAGASFFPGMMGVPPKR